MASKERPYLSAPTNREPQRACRGSAATSRVKPLGTGTRPPEPATGKSALRRCALRCSATLHSSGRSGGSPHRRRGQDWTPIGGQFSTPIDRRAIRSDSKGGLSRTELDGRYGTKE